MDQRIAAQIRHLSMKTVMNGCTPAEENSAKEKIAELREKYGVITRTWINAKVYTYGRVTLDIYLANKVVDKVIHIYSQVMPDPKEERKWNIWMFGDKPDVAKAIQIFRELIDDLDNEWKNYKLIHRASLKYKHGFWFCMAVAIEQIIGSVIKSPELTNKFNEHYPLAVPLSTMTSNIMTYEAIAQDAAVIGSRIGRKLQRRYFQ